MSARLALYLQPDVWELSLKAVYHSLRCSIATFSSIFCSGAFTKKQGGAFAEGQGPHPQSVHALCALLAPGLGARLRPTLLRPSAAPGHPLHVDFG